MSRFATFIIFAFSLGWGIFCGDLVTEGTLTSMQGLMWTIPVGLLIGFLVAKADAK